MEIDKDILNRFTINQSDMLFDLSKEDLFCALKENKCPKCGCNLCLMKNGKMYFCKSVKHKKRFLIGMEKLNKINGK